MKKVLGLDLGTTSIGWALVNEAENNGEQSEIIKLGVRVNPLTSDEQTNFEKGKSFSVTAERTQKRGARRNLQRYKQRRDFLISVLKKHQFIQQTTPLTEVGKDTTHQTLRLRAKAAVERIALEDLAKVFLAINKKRGYKSNRKTAGDDGVAIDGMAVAKELYDKNITPGQYVFDLLKVNKKYIPDFYRSDLQNEFDQIWNTQKTYYPEMLSDELYDNLKGENKSQTWAICKEPFNIVGIKLEGKPAEQKLKKYELRVSGLSEKLDLEHLAIVLQEINNDANKSSGYLGAISDRSKILYIDQHTVGQYLYKQIVENPHTSLKNQVFYRQDYLDEFEKIWETQAKYHTELTPELKEKIRDVVIFYQRKLKSQKGLLSFCEFESWKQTYTDKETGKTKERTVGHRVIPKSSPLFQEFKTWQNINNLLFKKKGFTERNLFNLDEEVEYQLDEETRSALFEELNLRGNWTDKAVLKFLGKNPKEWTCNFEKIEGNRTNALLYNVYQEIAEAEGYGFQWNKKSAKEIKEELQAIFPEIGIDPAILDFDANLKDDFDKQASYQLWHLLYAAEDDEKITAADQLIYGNSDVNLKKTLHKKYGFKPEYAKWLASVKLSLDYGSLSARAIRKIMPFLQSGNNYPEACALAGYKHSHWLTKEEKETKVYKDKLELLQKNSLRNPVVEKILNQMINLINQVIDDYGKPDEVRIELARELKKSIKEREELSKFINKRTKENEAIKKIIQNEFDIPNPTKNDVIRYRLWDELKVLGHKTVFTNEYISKDKLFSKDVDIEHIIPKAILFDDSFSNKTLAYREVNLKKADRTALDFITQDYNANLDDYSARVEILYKEKDGISRGKYKKLLMSKENLSDGFIERDLRDSQYIAKKAKSMLSEVFKDVVSTSGNITDKLREDWGLINVMKELNMPKYKSLGLTEFEQRLDKTTQKLKSVEIITDWSKRNDHRHHAMDALTVAFTTHSHIQYLNHLNARKDEKHKEHKKITAIEKKITHTNENGKRAFIRPVRNFRMEAKSHIESILVSFKGKNKVVTRNRNKTKTKKGYNTTIQLTPRGSLHKEMVYGSSLQPMEKAVKLKKNISMEQVQNIIHPKIKQAVLAHLAQFDNNIALAFDAKTLKKTPLLFNEKPLKEVHCYETVYTIRKPINSDLKINKVIDKNIRDILQKRLEAYGNDSKKAFSDLEKEPIWLNKNKGIAIKRVTIKGVNNVEALHERKDHLGNLILTERGKPIAADFVSTGNNHHVAIYRDEKGKLQEKLVSFYEAVARANQKLPIIDKTYKKDEGWQFLFSMKQNDMFVFPSEDFNPNDVELSDEKNAARISKHLFRVQKISSKDYFFRHHLETTVEDNKKTRGIAWERISLSSTILENMLKVRINHIGQIVQIGEY